jgi:hypothetical protein
MGYLGAFLAEHARGADSLKSGSKKPVLAESLWKESTFLVRWEKSAVPARCCRQTMYILGKRRFGTSLALRLGSRHALVPDIWMCLGQTWFFFPHR